MQMTFKASAKYSIIKAILKAFDGDRVITEIINQGNKIIITFTFEDDEHGVRDYIKDALDRYFQQLS